MTSVAHVVRVTIPRYLESLPVPSSFDEVINLSGDDWFSLLPFLCGVLVVFYSLGTCIRNLVRPRPERCNPNIKKSEPKVTDIFIREDLVEDKVSFCRCWRSKKWPYCDGSHRQHNQVTGDNVGALVIRSRDWKPKDNKDKQKK